MVRGGHAHKICHQLIIAVVGTFSCKVSNFNESETLQIDANGPSLYVPPLTWIEQYSFSENCVVAVLASHYYEEEDYIRNFTAFMDLKTNVYRKKP